MGCEKMRNAISKVGRMMNGNAFGLMQVMSIGIIMPNFQLGGDSVEHCKDILVSYVESYQKIEKTA